MSAMFREKYVNLSHKQSTNIGTKILFLEKICSKDVKTIILTVQPAIIADYNILSLTDDKCVMCSVD